MPPLFDPRSSRVFHTLDSLNQKTFHQHLLWTRIYFRLWRYISGKGRPESLCSLESESVCHSSCVWLSNPMDCSLLASSVNGIHQARILECAGSQREELRPRQRSWGRRLGICQGGIEPQESPWKFSSIYPQNQSLPTLLLCALTYTSDFMGGCPPPPLSEKELT